MTDQDDQSHIDRALKNTRSGIPFQSAVLRYCAELFSRQGSHWVFEVAEFPVSVRGADTRIDFVLHGRSQWGDQNAYLVCECKRPNPAMANWAFMRSPYWRRNRTERFTVFESIRVDSSEGRLISAPKRLRDSAAPYDVGLELKGDGKGEANPREPGRGAIEDAATQVCRGASGLIEFFKDRTAVLPQPALVIPVIFTTATLYVSPVDLGATDLNIGELPDNLRTSESPWLWFQYNLSSTIRHTAYRQMPEGGLRTLGAVLEYEYVRSIAVVKPNGIESFLDQMPAKLDAIDPLIP